jgi:rRNA maturation RNase YbeY
LERYKNHHERESDKLPRFSGAILIYHGSAMIDLPYMSFDISHTVSEYPRLPYEKMKIAVLGKTYNLSLNFIGTKYALTLNRLHRQAEYVPNVLSFPLTKTMGEIYITPRIAKKEAKNFGMSEKGYVGYLFIHGLLHLKGYRHGATMDKAEKKYITQFALT